MSHPLIGQDGKPISIAETFKVTTKLRQAEKAKIVYEENPNYTRGALIADFGGAMGLMLGLNILDVLVFSGSIVKLIAKKLRKGSRSS